MRKLEHSYFAYRNIKWCTHFGKQFGSSFKKKLNVDLLYDLVIALIAIYLREIKTHVWVKMNIHCSIAHNNWNVETTRMSVNWWMEKQMWHIHTMKYYSAKEDNKVLICTLPHRNLKHYYAKSKEPNTKERIVWFHLYEISITNKSIETK